MGLEYLTMRVNIHIFELLDDTFHRIKGGSTDRDWTDASGVRWTTLSELRKISKTQKTDPDMKTGRACTIEKVMCLIGGLIKLKGEDAVKRELSKLIASEKDPDVRILLKALIIVKSDSSEAKVNAETMLDMVIKSLNGK